MGEAKFVREGGCACGAARFTVRGEPKRAGLCHCLTCRKAHAAAFLPFVVFAADRLEVSGPLSAWMSAPGHPRWFCPACGSRVFTGLGDEIEVSIGSFDEPGLFAPGYEAWTPRREPWLAPLNVDQFEKNRAD